MRNRFLYFLEGIACILVIFIHIPFPGKFGENLLVIERLAVPLFFIVSGYFNYKSSKKDYFKRMKKQGLIFIIASVIYLALSFILSKTVGVAMDKVTLKDILRLVVFNYSNFIRNHLWFILAMIYTYLLNIILSRDKIKYFAIIPLFVIPLCYVLQSINPQITKPEFLSYTRNWLTIGVPFFAMGLILKEKEEKIKKISNIYMVLFAVIGIALSFGEAIVLKTKFNFAYSSDIYYGTILTIISLFMLAIKNPKLTKIKIIENLGSKYNLIIYLIHPLFIRIVNDVIVGYYKKDISEWIKPLIVVICSYITAVIYINSKSKIKALKSK